MKYAFYVFVSVLFWTAAKADTIDNWQVSHNEARIAAYNQNSSIKVVSIKKAAIKKGDVISLRYSDDTPCIDCVIQLDVEDGKHHSIASDQKTGARKSLTIQLDKLIDFQSDTRKNYFEFFYSEGEIRTPNDRKLVFMLVIEP